MDCYISVFQSLSSHIDEITEERKKKKKTQTPRGKENSLFHYPAQINILK